jgi:hypothetical protein
MEINSSLMFSGSDGIAATLSTVVDGRTLMIGIGVGTVSVESRALHAGLSTRALYDALGYQAVNDGLERPRITALEGLDRLSERITGCLAGAREGDVLFLLCSDVRVRQAAWATLNVNPGALLPSWH